MPVDELDDSDEDGELDGDEEGKLEDDEASRRGPQMAAAAVAVPGSVTGVKTCAIPILACFFHNFFK